jgi:FtsP/CotA-like multicopper oxidase with cupredoxin domain
MQHHTEPDPLATESFPTDPSGLPEAGRPQLLELAPGDTLDLRVAPVAKRLGDTTVRMLGYNGSIPGPTLKVAQGSEIVVHVTNNGDIDTTVHWHGLRLENKYDGVPHETQAPIPVGGEFTYRISSPMRACTGTTRTSGRTTRRSWACTATSWSSRPTRTTGHRSTASSC